MLSNKMILVTAVFHLLLRSSIVMSATPTRENFQKEQDYDKCDIIRKLIDNAFGAKQSLDN